MTAVDRITVRGFKSIREMDLELRPINVLVGANGAGKSNFLAVFNLLREMAVYGLRYYVAKRGGAERFLHFGSKFTPNLYLSIWCGEQGYEATLSPAVGDRFVISRERSLLRGTEGADRGKVFPIEFADPEPDLTESEGAIPKSIGEAAADWQIFHLHDTSDASPVRKTSILHDTAALRHDGANLPAFLRWIAEHHRRCFDQIVDIIQRVAPFIGGFILEPTPENPGTIRLGWRHRGRDGYFDASDLSDGTLRFICLATLLLQPKPPKTILIDEPELGLHPHAIGLLAELMRGIPEGHQVIASTQSVTLVNQLDPEDVIVVDRTNGESTFQRLSLDRLRPWLDDYGLGDVWEKNVFGGSPA